MDINVEYKFKQNRDTIKSIVRHENVESLFGKEVTCFGWIMTTREQKNESFIHINDGSCSGGLQIIVNEANEIEKGSFANVLVKAKTGASIKVTGKLVKSPAKGQLIELQAQTLTIIGEVENPETYPIAKTKISLETLREHCHLRPRTKVFSSVVRLRNACAFATHKFFNDRGFFYIHTPIITASDCEGAGEMFHISTLLKPGKFSKIPNKLQKKQRDEKNTKKKKEQLPVETTEKVGPTNEELSDEIDYTQDFFGKEANLTVSGQLNVEPFACSMSSVYTFGPTFRAENSNTTRHLAEFWMIEPEFAFGELEDDMNLAEDYLKFCIKYCFETCLDDLESLNSFVSKGLIDRLKNILSSPFARISYTDAVKLLETHISEKKVEFEKDKPVFWGVDFASEHEKYLCEKVYGKPTIVFNYPKEIKSFYMKQNEDGKTVQAMDILCPGIGEVIGGSVRENSYEKLVKRMEELKMDIKELEWYLDIRKYGSVPHAGFGLGFERLLLLVTGLLNIRDVIPYPRTPGNISW
eukprot:TRINITY_DN4069_c0_g1_i1.p1 TRINITY_DN4069_c0_g1~~TRINITY_DN4069_c0_g1_i1.p1  ORF type:complete len:525 (-),score=182.69 TRINITY_DN4069_c0_g1_i1:76-1650(-)